MVGYREERDKGDNKVGENFKKKQRKGNVPQILGPEVVWPQPAHISEFMGVICHLLLLWMFPWGFGPAFPFSLSFVGAGGVEGGLGRFKNDVSGTVASFPESRNCTIPYQNN